MKNEEEKNMKKCQEGVCEQHKNNCEHHKNNNDACSHEKNGEVCAREMVTKLSGENEKLKKEVERWKNDYYKVYADMDNLRKSIERDHFEVLKYRAEGFVGKLINVLDGFHLALNNDKIENEEIKNYLIGFKYIYNNLLKVLEEEGVKEIAPKIGESFDENNMEVMDTVYQDGEPNKIVKINLKGYKLKDRLIRPAVVVVSTDKKKETEEKNKK